MKVKTLIRELQNLDPSQDVKFSTKCGSTSGKVTGVYMLDKVTLECEATHFDGERI